MELGKKNNLAELRQSGVDPENLGRLEETMALYKKQEALCRVLTKTARKPPLRTDKFLGFLGELLRQSLRCGGSMEGIVAGRYSARIRWSDGSRKVIVGRAGLLNGGFRAAVVNTIRAWLGHVSINTTNIYAETDLQMKAKALGLCAVKSTRGAKRWRDNPDLMSFLAQI